MSYYIEDQITGLVDGYYKYKEGAEGVAEGLNAITRDHLFLVKNGEDRKHYPISDAEFLGAQPWFIDLISNGFAL